MPEDKIAYPSFEHFGASVLNDADIDVVDAAAGIITQIDEGTLDESATLKDFSEREVRMIAAEQRLRNGSGFITKLFGIEVEVKPLQQLAPPSVDPNLEDGGDLSGDREPRKPIVPSDTDAIAVPEISVGV